MSEVRQYSKTGPEWPLPDLEGGQVSLVNSVPSLEGSCPKSSLDACSRVPKDSSSPEDDRGRAEWLRKEFYSSVKAKVEKAVQKHKIFLIRGDLPRLRQALEERGWVQKYESSRTRTVPYGSVASLEAKSLGDVRKPDGTLNERALIFAMLRHRPPNFVWDCRNDFVEWDRSLGSHALLNRFQKSFVYTSKLGMAHLLQNAHWLYEEEVSSVRFPRSYNVSREPRAFLQDFRQTAATSLLKWFVEHTENARGIFNVGSQPIPVSQLEFAIKRCEEFLADVDHRTIDGDEVGVLDEEWSLFLDDCSKVLYKGNGIVVPYEDALERLEKYYETATSILRKLKDVDPQYELSGTRNIWIVKPSDLCCGTGIGISHNLKDIFRKVGSRPKDYFIVQKYIERPLLVRNTKFDIRQWYLVTSTFPLTIWLFKEGFLRFSSKHYTFSTYHEAIHICNTAIQEKYDDEKRRRRKRGGPEERVEAESIRDQEWDCQKLNEYLKSAGYKGEPYFDEIYPKMSQAIVLTMLASQEYMDRRRCSFELYGADFMVMDDLTVWLIEINTNPRMHPPSLKITQRLYSEVLDSLVKVILDVPIDPTADTGGFELAYRQHVPDFQPYLGPCLFVFGKSMRAREQPGLKDREKKSRGSNPGGKQPRAWTAPPMMPRLREPKVVDFIDYSSSSSCSTTR
ncbi:tubulin glycylase 3A [Orussus abietinus]|uniref:tubulin glycylase 3A n=1 Tax=Orussus abietinus TaxID=222816 RepID=UPI000626530A|nr:tubulin glycylase 3A [Orussus abietinus]